VIDKVRDSFRFARSVLGEDYCAWDDDAKVGPALTVGDIEAKKEREAEKRRRKRAKQKEKKAKEKAEIDEAEARKKEAEEQQQRDMEAKRIRDGLQPKKTGGGVCDYCQIVCKGQKRADMLHRLNYSYCSTACVQKHKRELMAAAATARFGTSKIAQGQV
jgi:Vms1-associating treble clef domain